MGTGLDKQTKATAAAQQASNRVYPLAIHSQLSKGGNQAKIRRNASLPGGMRPAEVE